MFQKNKMNKVYLKIVNLATIVVLVFIVFFLIHLFNGLTSQKVVIISDEKIKIELAVTPTEKGQGLSNRDELSDDSGMLFVYDKYLIPSFWMKEMRFPIDIIWIKDNMVMGYEKQVYPQGADEQLAIYRPKTFVNYVLEVNAGFIDEHGVKIGDKISF
jgi:uncharacterized membrane protein (UPF0127 family)